MATHINIKFPFEEGDLSGYFFGSNDNTHDAIKADILHILVTKKGERFMQPNFGTNLHKFLFEPNDSININDIKQELSESLATSMPNVKIKTLDAIYDDSGYVSEIILVAYDTDNIFNDEITINLNI